MGGRSESMQPETPPKPTLSEQAAAAVFYGISSLFVIFINKVVLSTYGFPSFNFLALSQFLATSIVLYVLKLTGSIQIQEFSRQTFGAVAPLTVLFLLNVLCGLGGTQRVSIVMFTALRRFSILMTMLLESYLLHSRASRTVQISVGFMLGGAILAAMWDLTFDVPGYFMILANDFFTAAYGVAMKKSLNSGQVGKTSLLFYNSLFSMLAMSVVLMAPLGGEMEGVWQFQLWKHPLFLMTFCSAACMGSVLNYSIFLCTSVNSALTTTVVGCLKNVLTTYLGMLSPGGGYVFSYPNFIGLNISIFGSLLYSYAKFNENNKVSKVSEPSSELQVPKPSGKARHHDRGGTPVRERAAVGGGSS